MHVVVHLQLLVQVWDLEIPIAAHVLHVVWLDVRVALLFSLSIPLCLAKTRH